MTNPTDPETLIPLTINVTPDELAALAACTLGDELVAVPVDDDAPAELRARQVLQTLVGAVWSGIMRPGSWERPWLCSAVGDAFTAYLEPEGSAPWRMKPPALDTYPKP
jgi:hypothetical protein